jgi:DNA-binding IclR family transcriptional regulator
MHLREIAKATGMSTSKVHRYLVSFGAAGMVKQDQESGRYDLGPVSVELGFAALSRIDRVSIVNTELDKLVGRIGLDAHSTVWTSSGPMVIRWKEGSRDVSIKVREGLVLPLVMTAVGRVWAAYQNPAVVTPLVESELDRLARHTSESRSALRDRFEAQVADIRRTGIARSEGERRLGIDGLAAPVFGSEGIAFVLALIGTHGDISLSLNSPPAIELRQAAERCSQLVGTVNHREPDASTTKQPAPTSKQPAPTSKRLRAKR